MRKIGINITISLALTAVLAAAAGAATEYDFEFRNYPNPFFPGTSENPNAKFSYVLPSSGSVSIYVYDLEGALVRTVAEGIKQVYGQYAGELKWNGRDDRGEYVDPGPYVVVLEVNIASEIYRDTFVAVVKR